ncbi:hypothetical protein ABHF33_01220 [Chitinibacter sp. FCG-7]|uniref:Uncharacterized protein n=1 Tax=Chitinibacter mangrovi TaxID=3153927 RepID=A0AAU7FAH7_9NEIS
MFSKLEIEMDNPETTRLRLVLLLDTLLCTLYGVSITASSLIAGGELSRREGTNQQLLLTIGLIISGILLLKALASWRARTQSCGWLGLSLLIGLPFWLLPLLIGFMFLLVPLLDGGEPFGSLWVVPGIYLGLFFFMGPTMALPIEVYPFWRNNGSVATPSQSASQQSWLPHSRG